MAGQKDEKRFWAKVDRRGDNECWPWLGWKTKKGYGGFDVWPKTIRAHGYAFALARGVVPEGYNLDHVCGNPACVNPRHLEPVTPLENIQRGRARARQAAQAKGIPATHNAKLTKEQAIAIRTDPRGYRRLAKVYGVCRETIRDVRLRKIYAHL